MQFEKGNKGRPVGSKNKDTKVKNAIRDGIDLNLLLEEIEQLPLKQKIDVKIKLLAYAYPKPAPTKEIEQQEHKKFEIVIVEPNDPNRLQAHEIKVIRNGNKWVD